MTTSRLIFCSVITPGARGEVNSLLLAESIRAFGGALADRPVWFFMPDSGKELTGAGRERLAKLGVGVVPFWVEREKLKFLT